MGSDLSGCQAPSTSWPSVAPGTSSGARRTTVTSAEAGAVAASPAWSTTANR